MFFRNFFKKITCLAIVFIFLNLSTFGQSQNLREPRQEKLLNGLKVLMWSDAKADKVSLKVRIHSGSAFDPQGKEGVTKLLANNIFPNESSKEFFAEDLGGHLEIISNYDYIQINASAKPDEFLTMLETVANAVSNQTIDKDTTAKLRAAQIEKVKELEKNPAYVADQAVAKRLFGTFPYGRPENGTLESLQKIDFADLIFIKERFLTADNATIALHGNFNPTLAYRAVRRFFGAWLKSDKRVPSTFRQPDDPDTKPLGLSVDGTGSSEVRYALRGLARNDKDFAASSVLVKILQARFPGVIPKDYGSSFSVSQIEHILPGMLKFGFSANPNAATEINMSNGEKLPGNPTNPVTFLFSSRVTDTEFSNAKSDVLNEINQKAVANWWLDIDTFRTLSVSDEMHAFQNVALADVQRVADRFAKNPVASVAVTPSK